MGAAAEETLEGHPIILFPSRDYVPGRKIGRAFNSLLVALGVIDAGGTVSTVVLRNCAALILGVKSSAIRASSRLISREGAFISPSPAEG